MSLTEQRKTKDREARPELDPIAFDPSITTGETLAEGLRIFTDPNVFSRLPAHRTAQGATVRDEETIVYTDSSSSNNGDADARAGSGVWCGRTTHGTLEHQDFPNRIKKWKFLQ